MAIIPGLIFAQPFGDAGNEGSNPMPPSAPGPFPGAPDDSGKSHDNPQGDPPGPPPERKMPRKDESRVFNYRGNRTYSENLPLKINQIKCTKVDNNMVCIEILFNQNINPRSVKHESLFIDNVLLPEICRFSFNKRGDTIKFIAPVRSQTFKLKVQNIRSFEGIVIEPVEMLVEVKTDL